MKKSILTIIAVSLSLLCAQPLTAQIKVLSNGNVKMGSLSNSTSTTYGLEIGYPKIRIHPSGVASSALSAPDIYIYGKSQAPYFGTDISGLPAAATAITYTTVIECNNLQIGTDAHPALLIGDPRSPNSSGVAVLSDRRYKNNIRHMENGLAEILQLQPIRFDYIRTRDDESFWDSVARFNKVGFIAQDVKSIIPEAVRYDIYGDYYSLNQTDFIPYIVAGIQELNAIIQAQNETIQELMDRIEYLESENAAIPTPTFSSANPQGRSAEAVEPAANRLWSNVPNPFKQETRIRYALSEEVREAQLCIYDLSGQQLACHRLIDRGESEFTLRAASLKPGIYLYSLIADGNVVDTHRMVVTE